MPRNTLKNEYFYVYASFLKEICVRTQVAIYNIHVRLKYTTFCIATHVYLLVYATVVSATHVRLVMQLTPSVVTTLSSTLTIHKAYK